MTAEQINGWIGDIVTQTLPTVQEQAKALSSLDSAVIVISGDPATIQPQLEEIGIHDAQVLSLDD